MFVDSEHPGMVGETVSCASAYLVAFKRGCPCIEKELKYEDLRAIYRTMMKDAFKSERIAFWRAMNAMSPESEAQRQADNEADAISRVI